MRRLAYLVLAFLAVLSIAVMALPGELQLLPSIHKAHAVSHSIVLVGCVFVSGPCGNVGWNGTTPSPNPTITVVQGDVVSISLSSGDGLSHQFQLDVDNDGGQSGDCGSTTDPCSSPFPPSTTFMFIAIANPGTYTYYCTFHTTQMHGTFIISPSSTVGGVATSPSNPAFLVQYLIVASIVLIGVASSTVHLLRNRRKHSGSSRQSL